jgi:hypothetical protein
MLTQGCRRPQRIHVADGVDLDASNANMFRVDAGAPLRAPTACTPPGLHPPSRVTLDSAVAKRLEGLAPRRPVAAKLLEGLTRRRRGLRPHEFVR